MSSPSREHLLGFLLQALSPLEQQEVEAELDRDPELRAEMRLLESSLARFGLTDAPEPIEPPAGLAARTCHFVSAQIAAPALATPGAIVYQPEPLRKFTWSDLVTMAAVLVAAASLFFPALSFSRFQSHIASCQNQLRLIGFGLHSYSELQPDHSFPGPEAEGNRASAGIVAPLLVSHQLADSRMFLCPASSVVREGGEFRVPLPEDIDRASEQELKALRRTMAGDYGFPLGYLDGGMLQRVANSRRSDFAIAGDAPSNSQPRRVSANHRGRGQNVLFEDGRVQFLPQLPSPRLFDDPYHNRHGWVAAGIDRNDAVLGASGDPPLPVSLVGETRR